MVLRYRDGVNTEFYCYVTDVNILSNCKICCQKTYIRIKVYDPSNDAPYRIPICEECLDRHYLKRLFIKMI